MKYYLTHANKTGFKTIVERIKNTGENAYKYYNCMPTKIIELTDNYDEFEKGKQFVVFENYNDYDIEYFRFLGFGFEGLYEDEDKIKVIESFGKYRCIVYNDTEIEFPNEIIKEVVFSF